MNPTSVYCMVDPTTNEVRYVGKTRRTLTTRLKGHCTKLSGCGFESPARLWVLGLKQQGLIPEIMEIERYDTDVEAAEAEKFWIAYFGYVGANLTNRSCNYTMGSRTKQRDCYDRKKVYRAAKAKKNDFLAKVLPVYATRNLPVSGLSKGAFHTICKFAENMDRYNMLISDRKHLNQMIGLNGTAVLTAMRELLRLDFIRERTRNVYMVNPNYKCNAPAGYRLEVKQGYSMILPERLKAKEPEYDPFENHNEARAHRRPRHDSE